MSMLESLKAIDESIFLTLNGMHTPDFDGFMFLMSKVWLWIPIYVIFVIYLIRKWKMESIWIILSVVICLVLTDQLTNLTKDFFGRLRPSHNPEFAGLVHHVNGYMGGKFGFVSGHASNVFGFALLSSLIVKNYIYSIVIFFWAALIAYSRIYLGVHYPFDILGGMMLGMSVAAITFLLLQGFRKKLISEIKSRFF